MSTSPSTASNGGVIACHNITITRGNDTIINKASFTLNRGESASITGPTGSGKTSILNAVLGFLRPGGGNLIVAGCDLKSASSKEVLTLRRKSIGVVFQSGELLDQLTPEENVLIAALLAGAPRADALRKSRSLLDQLRVPQRESTALLSGGERQRVAIARALVTSPRLLVADEPTASLDVETRDDVMRILKKLPQDTNCALLIVTHDPAVAAQTDKTYRLDGGVLQGGILRS